MTKATLEANKIVQLCPLECDSTVAFKVVRGRRLWGSVQLADCGRKIDWHFASTTPISKIDNAISALQEFREELVKSRKAKRRVARKSSRPRARGR